MTPPLDLDAIDANLAHVQRHRRGSPFTGDAEDDLWDAIPALVARVREAEALARGTDALFRSAMRDKEKAEARVATSEREQLEIVKRSQIAASHWIEKLGEAEAALDERDRTIAALMRGFGPVVEEHAPGLTVLLDALDSNDVAAVLRVLGEGAE
jgi:CHASE1-domain containing sensor protein